MNQRRPLPWPWIIGTAVVVVLVGAAAYVVGASHAGAGQDVGFAHIGVVRPVHAFGWTRLAGFWLPVLLIALLVGLIVAAIARPARRLETFEEWHRREHEPPAGQPPAAPPAPPAGAPGSDGAAGDDARPPG